MGRDYQAELLRYALDYARAGYYVFPLTVLLDDNGKKRLIIPFTRHDGGWTGASTRDEDTIRDWFSIPRRGMKGLGIDTGKSGIVAIDLDVNDRVNGVEEWNKLPAQQETPMTVRTRSGGIHRFYRDPSGRIRNSAGDVAPGIDIRGAGGFVIAPPTRVFGSDGVYTLGGELVPVADLPELTPGMIDIITARQDTAKPRFDPAIHGNYRVSLSQAESIIERRFERLREGRGMRSAIFGVAVGIAQLEAGKARRDGVELDPDTLAVYIAEQIQPVVPWPDLNEEDWQWITDGVVKGLAHPWEIIPEADALPEIDADIPLDDLMQREARRMPGHPRTDHALAAPIVVDELRGRYIYVAGLGWHEWVGDRWSADVRVPVRHAVQDAIHRHRAEAERMLSALQRNHEYRSLQEHAEELRGDEQTRNSHRLAELEQRIERARAWAEGWTRYLRWWTGLANGRDLDQVLKFVEAHPGEIYVSAGELDRDPYALNCPNGTVDLRTGELRPHNPRDLITKTTHVPYDPEASHPLWDRAREAFAPGIEDWLRRKVGEGAIGLPPSDDTILFSFGAGSNGKSTLADAILRSLGDYAVFLHDKAVLGNEHDHGTEKMVFRGARWAILEELPEAQVLRPALIKKLVGTSRITARKMRQDNITFDATHTILVNSNHRPQVLENDRGTWRRLVAIPWPYTYKFEGEEIEDETERRADPEVKRALAQNLEVRKAALAWIVRGAVEFCERGSCGELPDAVRRETEDWRRESDVFGTFFADEMVLDREACVSSKELLDAFNDHLESMGKKSVSETYILTRLASMPGAKHVRTGRVMRNAKRVRVSSRGPVTALPERFRAIFGIRWLADQEKTENTA